ncbi:MAG: hypothetical protein M1570_06065 [Chloroflexi bacterium]|nr:hypothetical protein [Chloroflexota bacterium]
MRRTNSFIIVIAAVVFLFVAWLVSLYLTGFLNFSTPATQAVLPTTAPAQAALPSGTAPPTAAPAQPTLSSGAPPPYSPPKPEDAPQDIRDAVLLGQKILTDTQKMLPTYVGNQVNCTNCHFNAGLTQAGKNGGLSLVGVGATYPKYRTRQKFAVDLVARAND